MKDGCMTDGSVWDWSLEGYRRGTYWAAVTSPDDLSKDRDSSDDKVVGSRLRARSTKTKSNSRKY